MSSIVFEPTGPHRPVTHGRAAEQRSAGRGTASWLRCGAAAFAMALALAGCGGGGGDATPTAAAPDAARPDQVAAFALTQQNLAALTPPQPVALAAADGSGNLVANGGFENGLTGWANWGNAGGVAGQASSGSSALSVGTAAGGAGQEIAGIVPGTTYRLTAQAKVSAAGETVYVGVNFLDQSGAPLTQNAQLVDSTAYTAVGFDVPAPPNAVRALVYVWKNTGSGLANVDDVALVATGSAATSTAAGANLVSNGGFENGFTGWDHWGARGISSTQAASGAAAAQVGTGAGGFGQDVAVVAGTSYRLSAQAMVSTPGELGYLGVMFMDSAGNGLLVQNVVFRSTAYATAQADVTAPANATKALVFVWKNDGSGFAYVDDVALTPLAAGGTTAPGPELPAAAPLGTPVFQLPWGGEVSGQVFAFSPDVLRQYSTAGLQVGGATTINLPGNGGSATVLEGGGYGATWLVNVGVSSAQIFSQAFTAAAQPIGSPVAIAFSPVGDSLGNPAAVPQLAPLAGGGYVVVWALQQSAPGAPNDRGVYTQRFDANGQPMGPAQQATADGAGFLHITGTTTGGYVVSWGKSAGTVGGARAYGADGAPLAPEQVAGTSWHTGAGPRGSMAPLAGGGAAIVWQVRGQPVFVQHISASGVALPAQVASTVVPTFYALVANAGLPDGGSLVAWFDVADHNVYARRFAADGTPLGPQTRINLVTTPTNGVEIMVLADGSFTIAWDVGTTRYARTFPADGLGS